MKNATLTAEAPRYATDGSRGYYLSATNGHWVVDGWIYAEDDGAVYATIDRARWQRVGTTASPTELTLAWIADHAGEILQPF